MQPITQLFPFYFRHRIAVHTARPVYRYRLCTYLARYGSGESGATASAGRQPPVGFKVTERFRETANALHVYMYIVLK